MVFALGRIGHDFGTDARRTTFARHLTVDGVPEDPTALLAHLERAPADCADVIWTVEHEGTPVYAIEPVAEFAPEIFGVLAELYREAVGDDNTPPTIERISVAGWLPGRTVRLQSGADVPVLVLDTVRGLYGWSTAGLVDAVVDSLPGSGADPARLKFAVRGVLDRIYHEHAGLGDTSRSRALNFAATNILQLSAAMRGAIAQGMELIDLRPVRSAYSRPRSNCWDLRARFRDPEREERGQRVVVFTVDVGDLLPVTVGETSTWQVPTVRDPR